MNKPEKVYCSNCKHYYDGGYGPHRCNKLIGYKDNEFHRYRVTLESFSTNSKNKCIHYKANLSGFFDKLFKISSKKGNEVEL